MALEYTIGEVIDRLAITNLKLWHTEEQLQRDDLTLEEKGELCEQIVKLNELRLKCIDAINEFFKKLDNKL